MKAIIKYTFVGLLFLSMIITSCMEDKGNYDYTPVSPIKIDTIGNTLARIDFNNAAIGNLLKFKPVVTYTKDLTKLQYYWFIYAYYYVSVQEGNAIVWPQPDTICRSHELDWIVDAKPGSYNMQFMVVDPETGLSAFQNYYLNIPSKGTKSGLYILSEYNGATDIDLYGSALALIIGGDHFTPKYYSSTHAGEQIQGTPRFISYGKDSYYAFSEQEGLRLSPDGLQLMDEFNGMFYNTPAYNPQKVMYTNNCEFILNDGKLHVMYTSKANDRKFSAPIAGTYQAGYSFLANMTKTTYSPVVGAITSDQVIFDISSNAFRPYFPMASAISQFKETVPTAFLDANNLGNAPVAIFEGNGGKTYCIMHNNGKDSLYVFNFYNRVDNGDLSAAGGNSKVSLEGCQGIAQAKYFASGNSGSAFFYATIQSVYSFSYTSGQTAQENIYQCGANEEVTCLYQMPSGGFPTAGCVLWIAVWNSQTNQGKLVEFEIDPATGKIRSQWGGTFAPSHSNPHITEGFGKIKSMIIKM